MRLGLKSVRSVLSRAERIQRLKTADRWQEGESPFGLAKVRVYKLAMKKKKKKEEEEGGPRGPRARRLRRLPRRPRRRQPRRSSQEREGGRQEVASSIDVWWL